MCNLFSLRSQYTVLSPVTHLTGVLLFKVNQVTIILIKNRYYCSGFADLFNSNVDLAENLPFADLYFDLSSLVCPNTMKSL